MDNLAPQYPRCARVTETVPESGGMEGPHDEAGSVPTVNTQGGNDDHGSALGGAAVDGDAATDEARRVLDGTGAVEILTHREAA